MKNWKINGSTIAVSISAIAMVISAVAAFSSYNALIQIKQVDEYRLNHLDTTNLDTDVRIFNIHNDRTLFGQNALEITSAKDNPAEVQDEVQEKLLEAVNSGNYNVVSVGTLYFSGILVRANITYDDNRGEGNAVRLKMFTNLGQLTADQLDTIDLVNAQINAAKPEQRAWNLIYSYKAQGDKQISKLSAYEIYYR